MKVTCELKSIKELYNLTKNDISIKADNTGFSAISPSKDNVLVAVDLAGEVMELGTQLLDKDIINNIKIKNADITITDEELEVGNRKFKYVKNDKITQPIHIGNKVAELTPDDYNKIINVEYAVSTSDARPILKNVYVNKEDIVALDGYRLAIRKNNVVFAEGNKDFLIPLSMIKFMKKIKPSKNIEVFKNWKFISLKIDNITLTSEYESGEYINYKMLLPSSHEIKVVIDVNEVVDILKGYNKDFKLLRLDIKSEEMIMKVSNKKFAIEDKLNATSNNNIEIGMNPKYFKEALINYNDKITINIKDQLSPFYVEQDGKYDLMLPVKILK